MNRREFLTTAAAGSAVGAALPSALLADERAKAPVIDTHMHVWAKAGSAYPFPHPYQSDFMTPPHDGTLEMLLDDMDAHGCTHAVLVQVIYHGWDNRYVVDCIRRHPNRLKAHGLIDPTDPKVADKLEFWIKEQG